MMRASGILLLAHLAQQSGVCAFAPFAMSSSSSSKRKVKTNQGKAAGEECSDFRPKINLVGDNFA
eukprot:scaffold1887_cov67-Skeletonema_dohrnii-CCMP3373.AAC.2